MSKEKRKPFHEQVAENIIKQLEAGTAPWQVPWEPGQPNAMMPVNATSGKRYRGINAINLMMQGRSDTRWLTYNQAKNIGGQVRKGEKGTTVQYWKFTEERNKLDENGKPELDKDGKNKKVLVTLERPRVFYATVFNAEQVDGMPPREVVKEKKQSWNASERAEHILAASGAKITHVNGDRAFYRPSTDSITLPERSQFKEAESYYATALHELGHWTGHPSRLDRDLSNPFGSVGYAKEELRAEIASMILGDELGVGHDPSQHVAYVENWVQVLKEDPMEIFRAAADAEKIQNFVLGFEQKQVQEQTQEQQITQKLNLEKGELPEGWKVVVANGMTVNEDPLNGGIVDRNMQFDRWFYVSHKEGVQSSGAEFGSREEAFEALYEAMREVDLKQEQQLEVSAEVAAVELPDPKNLSHRERIYINVPFPEKDEAKDLGARWDRSKKSWYVPIGVDRSKFEKWDKPEQSEKLENTQTEAEVESKRTYLAVPYEERNAAKAAGARWDKAVKSWYAGENADLEKLEKWSLDKIQAQSEQSPAMTPIEEFGEALKTLGFVVEDGHPVMDSKPHRISVEGDKRGEKSGFYVGHLDGHPAGYIKNNRTGVEQRWKAKGYSLSPEEKAKMQAEAAQKLADRAKEQEATQLATAERLENQAKNLIQVSEATPYLEAKGVKAHKGVLTDTSGKRTYIPAMDANGKQWTTQYIQEDGTKRFAKDSRKEGCFHAVGGLDAVAAAPVLVIGEGYATAASVAEALGQATVAAFDAGNLEAVAIALSQKFPDKPVLIAGDDDTALVLTHGVNAGREKAIEAANAVGGKAVFPVFASGENSYPTNIPPVTPELFAAHSRAKRQLEAVDAGELQINSSEKKKLEAALLGSEQLEAIGNMKKHTDFNDLAENSVLGREGVARQVRAAASAAIDERQKKKVVSQKQEQVQDLRKRRAARI